MSQPNATLFTALEEVLREADEPLDCATIFDMPIIREHATTVNRVSDYLGNMWRKGQVLRLPAPRLEGTRARWLYVWKNKAKVDRKKLPLDNAIEFDGRVNSFLSRPSLEITEEGGTVVITLPNLTITIKQR